MVRVPRLHLEHSKVILATVYLVAPGIITNYVKIQLWQLIDPLMYWRTLQAALQHRKLAVVGSKSDDGIHEAEQFPDMGADLVSQTSKRCPRVFHHPVARRPASRCATEPLTEDGTPRTDRAPEGQQEDRTPEPETLHCQFLPVRDKFRSRRHPFQSRFSNQMASTMDVFRVLCGAG